MTTQTVTLRLVAENGQLVGTLRGTKKELEGLGTGAQQAGAAADKGFAQASRGAERTSTFITRAKQAAIGFAGAFASIQGVRAAVGIADQYANITAQLRLATRSQAEYATAQAEVFSISQRTSTALDSTANLYARITRSTAELGIEQGRILALTETINQTFAVSGTSAVNQANAITQLTQAFAGGVLRAEEFNSVIENSPRLAQAIADGMGIGMGELRRQVNEGVVDVQRLIGALESQAESVAEEFSEMPLTIERAWVQIGNAVTAYVGQADQASGRSRDLANALSTVADNIGTIINAGLAAAMVAIAVGAGRAGGALATYTAGILAETYARQQSIAVSAAADAAYARLTAAKVRGIETDLAHIASERALAVASVARAESQMVAARTAMEAARATGSAGVAAGALRRAEQELMVAMRMRAAETAAITRLDQAAAAAKVQHTGATLALSGATSTATASAAAMTLGARTAAAAMGVLRGALALVGGPVGLAVTAGLGVAYYVSTLESAEERTARLNTRVRELSGGFAELSRAAAVEELEQTQRQISVLDGMITQLQGKLIANSGQNRGWLGDWSESRATNNLKAAADERALLIALETQLTASINGTASAVENYVEQAGDRTQADKAVEDAIKTANESAAGQIALMQRQLQLMSGGVAADEAAKRAKLELDGVAQGTINTLIATERRMDAQTQATERSRDATEAAAKAWSDYQDTLSKRADAYDQALFSVQDEIKYQTELNRLLRSGVSEAEAEAQARRALEPIQSNAINTERDRLAALQASNAAIVQGREAQAEASRKAQEQARETAQASQRAAADINRSLTDALLRGFEDGRNIADNFFETLKNTAAALVLRPVIEFALKPLSSVLGSIAGGGGGGLLSALTGGGGGGGPGLLSSLFGGGVSLAQGATLGFQGGGVLGAAQGFADAALTNLGEGIANLGARFGSASAQSFGSSISASAGSLGNVLGAAGLGYLGGSTVGGLLGLSGDGQTGAGIGGALGAGLGSLGGPLGALVGGAIGTALGGLVGSTFGGSGWKTDDVRLSGEFTGADFDGSLMQYNSKKRSLGRSTRRRNTELDATEFEGALSDLFGNVFAVGTDAAERLGLSVSDFSYRIDESIMGLEGDALAEKLLEIVSGASDAWAEQTLPGLERYRLEGESSAETFFRVAGAAVQMQDSLARVNQTMHVTGQDLVRVSQILLDQFGGSLEAFEAAVGGFYDRFYSDAEKFQRDRATLGDAFGGIDISGLSFELPDSREGFREFVEGINLTMDSGARAYAVLTSLSEVADRYYATLETREADRAELLGDINGRIDELTMSAQALDLLRLDREFDQLRARADELDLDSTLIDQLYALERAAREAGATVDELARQRSVFDSEIRGRLARQGLQGRDLESFDLEAEYSAAIAEAQRLGADLTAVETYFQGERNRIAQSAADEALEIERAAAVEAARQAQAIASERTGLLRELYQVEGNTAALRAMERDALDASNQPLYDRIQALRDSAAAEAEATRATEARTAAAAQAVEAARRNAVAAYDAEIARLQGIVGAVADARSRVDAARSNAVSIYERERSALQATADEFRSLAAGIAEFRAGLREELAGPQAAAASAQRAFADVARRASLGDRTALAELPGAGSAARESALANAPTRQDYLDQLGAIDAAAAEAESVAGRQASIADQQLAQLDATASRLGLLNEQMETLDGAVRTLQSAEAALAAAEIAAEQAQMQIEELIAARDGISQVNTSVLSVGAAVSQLAVAQAQYASAVASGLGSLQSQISGLQAAQQAIPQFAAGGDHLGGLRIVGERGPELELTGAARILNAQQTRAILSAGGGGGGGNAELVALLREIAAQNASILRALTSVGITVERMEFRGEDWDINGLPQERAA